MSAPTQDEYFAEGFDPNTLKVPQLRSILVEHSIPFGALVKKSDLVDLFEEKVRPKASKLLAQASGVRASAQGIIAVSENGDEAPVEVPVKRGRGRPKKSVSVVSIDDSPEPAAKRMRGSSRVTVDTEGDTDSVMATPGPSGSDAPLKRGRGRPRKTVPTMSTEGSIDSLLGSPAETPMKRKAGRPRKTIPTVDDTVASASPDIEEIPAMPESSRSRRTTLNLNTKQTPEADTPPPMPVPSSTYSRKSRQSSLATRKLTPEAGSSDKTPIAAARAPPSPAPRSILKKDPVIHFLDQQGGESEADENPRHTPVKRKASRTPRRSDGEESGFSDVNPFQSGSENAARKELRRRKSSVGPSAIQDTPQQSTPRQARRSEPAAISFTPGSVLRRVGPSRENLRAPPEEIREQLMQERELQEAEDHNQVITTKLNEISTNQISAPIRNPSPEITVTSSSEIVAVPQNALIRKTQDKLQVLPSAGRTIPLSALFLVLLSWVAQWKHASSAIGFCDTGGSTNDIILIRENKIDNAQACIARNAALQLDSAVSQPKTDLVRCDTTDLPLLPFLPRPSSCTPCPPHAICEDGRMIACEQEYILAHHPLSIMSPLADGLPGFESRVFPPSCKPDTAKKRMIGGVAQEVERALAHGRGDVVCAGLGKEDGRKGEGERFGTEESVLREIFDARRDPKFSKEQFDEIWEAALKDLIEHEDVIESIDLDGKTWYAASRTDMTLGCRVKTEAYKSLDAWKAQLGSTAAVLAAIAALQRSVKTRRAEKYKAEDLAQVVLRRLQDQERLHYTDPATTPQPYLPPAQVRDLVLPHRGSVSSRTRLWTRIETLVEKNANVAVREQEVNGEIWRTWQWTGVGMLGGPTEEE